MNNFVEQFKEAIGQRGLIPPNNLVADGKIHRCDVIGEHGEGDGSYLLHSDFPQAGGFQNWKDGKGWEKWSVKGEYIFLEKEKEEYRLKREAIQREREEEEKKRIIEMRKKATFIWQNSLPCTNHAYLSIKGIKTHGIRIYKEALTIPLKNMDGEIQGLQFIDKEGKKKYLTSTQKIGSYFFEILRGFIKIL